MQKIRNIFLSNKIIVITIFITLLFLFFIAINISPYLRGPNDPLLESHWPYYFVNTFPKLWFPLLIFLLITIIYVLTDRKKYHTSKKQEIIFLTICMFLAFLFQLSLVYFSRFGIGVLFRRVADQGINGYFTTAVEIKSISWFLHNYTGYFAHLHQHARGHPPGGVVLYRLIIDFFSAFSFITNAILSHISAPKDVNSRQLWNHLTDAQRVAALCSGFIMHFLSTITLIPLYFFVKQLFSQKVAVRTLFIYMLIPSAVFFSIFLDPFYAFFPVTSVALLYFSLVNKKNALALLSGIMFGIGLFFSLSFIPLIVILGCIIFWRKNVKERIIYSSLFITGIVAVILLMFLIGFNFLLAFPAIIGGQAARTYLLWIFYDVYDFFVYLGIPLSILFIYISIKQITLSFKLQIEKIFLYSFWIAFILLDISGISRGETGRIWVFFAFLPAMLVSWFTTNRLQYGKRMFFVILLLLFLQNVIMEEFWVPVW